MSGPPPAPVLPEHLPLEHERCQFAGGCHNFRFAGSRDGLCHRHHQEVVAAQEYKKAHAESALLKCSQPSPAFKDFGPHMSPDDIWKIYQKYTVHRVVKALPSRPQPKHTTRFVIVSDTHNKHSSIPLPAGDVLIHCGDFSSTGLPGQVQDFNKWLGSVPYQHKIVIAGNHDITFDSKHYHSKWMKFHHKRQFDSQAVKASLDNCIYLEDSMVEIGGFRIWGSPWQPAFCDWGFNLERGKQLRQKWDMIPDRTDILVTHGPPLGFGDMCKHGGRVGCMDLLDIIQNRVRPKLHLFGHVHEDYGLFSDDTTLYVNASTCTFSYRPTNPPIVIDLPNPNTRDFEQADVTAILALNQLGAKAPVEDPKKPKFNLAAVGGRAAAAETSSKAQQQQQQQQEPQAASARALQSLLGATSGSKQQEQLARTRAALFESTSDSAMDDVSD